MLCTVTIFLKMILIPPDDLSDKGPSSLMQFVMKWRVMTHFCLHKLSIWQMLLLYPIMIITIIIITITIVVTKNCIT